MEVCAALIVVVRALVAMVFLEWVGEGVSALFVVLLVVDGFVLYGVIIGVVVVTYDRFLGSGLVGGVGRTSVVAFCCGGVLVGKRVIVRLVSWHACCYHVIRMFFNRS